MADMAGRRRQDSPRSQARPRQAGEQAPWREARAETTAAETAA